MQADAQEVAPPVNLKERRPSVADRNIENASTEVPEIPDELERVLVFALDEAKEKIEGGEDVIPFTTLVVKDNLFIESHPGDSAESASRRPRRTCVVLAGPTATPSATTATLKPTMA